MDSIIRKLCVAAAAIVLCSSPVHAEGLIDIFQQALKNDPLIGSANYRRYATEGDKDAACGRLWPQVTIPASYVSYDQDKAGTVLGQDSTSTNGEISGEQARIGVTVNQTLFDMPKFTECRMARINVNRGGCGVRAGL